MAFRGRTFESPNAAGKLRDSSRVHVLVSAMAPILLLYILYTIVRWSVVDRAALAGDVNALRVLHLEHRLGIDWELAIQQRIVAHDWLVWLANHYYVYAFFPVLVGAAVVSAVRAPRTFHLWRSVFALSLGFALIGFAIFPLTPPRLMTPEYGFFDMLMRYGPQYYGDESGASLFNLYGSIPSLVNEYAAMPSMHVGWSAIASALIVATFPARRWLLILAVLHVVAMQLAVVATGNHFVIDGVAGLLVVGISYRIVRRFACVSWTSLITRRPEQSWCAGD